jgi:tetratricopeptide (TPR) repeat protein
MKEQISRLLLIAGGFVIGACLSVLLAGFVYSQRTAYLANKVKMIDFPTLPKQTPASTPSTPSVAISDAAQQLDAAKAVLQNGEPEKVENLILPYVDSWLLADDQAQGYLLVGQAEKQMDHAQLAVPYIKKSYTLQPSAQTLFLLAETYDQGGDIRNAVSSYQQLIVSPDPSSGVDYDKVRQRIIVLETLMGTQVPQPASPP